MADLARVRVGELRWRVIIAIRQKQFDEPGVGTGMFDEYRYVATVRANIEPISASTFYDSAQVDSQVTHRITMRWQDYLDNQHVIIWTSQRRDGTWRSDLFRVKRVKELNGRKRFSSLDVEQEKSITGELDRSVLALQESGGDILGDEDGRLVGTVG